MRESDKRAKKAKKDMDHTVHFLYIRFYTNTQMRKYTDAQIHICANTQIHKSLMYRVERKSEVVLI